MDEGAFHRARQPGYQLRNLTGVQPLNRARLVGLNVVGLKRRGFDKAQIQLLHAAFRDLFRHEGVFAQRLALVRERYAGEPLVGEVLAFIDAPSHRGLIRAE